jgi:hypothetical protein
VAIGVFGGAMGGCPTPAQEGGLARVDTAGFAGRLEMMCGAGYKGPSCPPPRDASVADEYIDAADHDHDHDRDHDRDHDGAADGT